MEATEYYKKLYDDTTKIGGQVCNNEEEIQNIIEREVEYAIQGIEKR